MISNRSNTVLATALVATIAMACICAPYAAAKFSNRYVEQYTMVMKQVLQADAAMYSSIEAIAQHLDQYYRKHGHLPKGSDEQEAFTKTIAKYLAANPYQPKITDLYEGKQVGMDKEVPLYFLTDSGLNEQNISHYIKHPPESWQAEPGTVFIMDNGASLYLIWAASADRLPMRDFAKDGAPLRVLVHNFGYSDGTPASELGSTGQTQ